MIRSISAAVLFLALAAAPALAHVHPAEHSHNAFMSGFTHPFFGLDHILAMIAVGLWASSLSVPQTPGQAPGKALWLVPAAFVGTMAIGFLAAIAGVPLPFVEPAILASVIFIGIMVALALPLPTIGVAAVVAFFALFHGHAHGEEMGHVGPWGYAAGFLLATILLQAVGIAIGVVAHQILANARGAIATRIAGGLTALGGLWLAIGG